MRCAESTDYLLTLIASHLAATSLAPGHDSLANLLLRGVWHCLPYSRAFASDPALSHGQRVWHIPA